MHMLNPSTDPNPAPLPLCLVPGQFQTIVALHRGVLGSGAHTSWLSFRQTLCDVRISLIQIKWAYVANHHYDYGFSIFWMCDLSDCDDDAAMHQRPLRPPWPQDQAPGDPLGAPENHHRIPGFCWWYPLRLVNAGGRQQTMKFLKNQSKLPTTQW